MTVQPTPAPLRSRLHDQLRRCAACSPLTPPADRSRIVAELSRYGRS